MPRPRLRPEILVLFVLALGLGAWSWLRVPGAPVLSGSGGPPESRAPEAPLPRIALERLSQEAAGQGAAGGERDVFRFGQPPAPPAPPRPVPVATLPVVPADAGPVTPAPPPTLPPLAVKFVGSVEQHGTRVAILMTEDKKEVLTGREGDTVANRLKIVKIGFESVEVQDLGSGRVRRIPLKGN